MSVDELIDQLASLSLRAGRASQEGTSKKLEYKDKGEFDNPTATFFFEQQEPGAGALRPVSVHHRRVSCVAPSPNAGGLSCVLPLQLSNSLTVAVNDVYAYVQVSMPSSSWRHTLRECGLGRRKVPHQRLSGKQPSRRGRGFSKSPRRDCGTLPGDWVSDPAFVLLRCCAFFISSGADGTLLIRRSTR